MFCSVPTTCKDTIAANSDKRKTYGAAFHNPIGNLSQKDWVIDMVIAIALDGYTVGEYAAEIGDDANNVSHRYRRAINKLKEFLSKTSF